MICLSPEKYNELQVRAQQYHRVTQFAPRETVEEMPVVKKAPPARHGTYQIVESRKT